MRFLLICMIMISSNYCDVLVPITSGLLGSTDIIVEGIILKSEIVSAKSVGNDLVNDPEYIAALKEELDSQGYCDSLKEIIISHKEIDSSAIHKITLQVNKFYKGFEEKLKLEFTYSVRRFGGYSEDREEHYIRDWSNLKVGDSGIFYINNSDNRKSFEGMIPSANKKCIDVINLFFDDDEYFNLINEKCNCYSQDLLY